MLKALREQVQGILYVVPAKRRPALRRSDEEDMLFATDLPLVAADDAVASFQSEMIHLGWRCEERSGWLVLDVPVPVPPEADIPDVLAGECGCCISILLRHKENAPAEDAIRAVVKAAEAGRVPFEGLCSQLHGTFAIMLREKRPLPGALLPYLCKAYQKLYK